MNSQVTPINNTNSIKSISPSIRTIKLLHEICNKKCRPMVAFIPSSNFWDPNEQNEKYKNELKQISNELRIPFIDGGEVISSNNRDDYAPKGGHLSKEGYKKMADIITSRMQY